MDAPEPNLTEVDGPFGEATPTVRAARGWRAAAGLAILAVYLPQLLPLVLTDLVDHGHCLAIYARYFPVLTGLGPGISARIHSGIGEPGEEVVLFVTAVLVALTLLVSTAYALRRWRRAGPVLALGVAGLSAMLSMGAVALIRS